MCISKRIKWIKKKPPWKFFFAFFLILSSSRHEKCCRMSERFFCLFQCSKNIQCTVYVESYISFCILAYFRIRELFFYSGHFVISKGKRPRWAALLFRTLDIDIFVKAKGRELKLDKAVKTEDILLKFKLFLINRELNIVTIVQSDTFIDFLIILRINLTFEWCLFYEYKYFTQMGPFSSIDVMYLYHFMFFLKKFSRYSMLCTWMDSLFQGWH